MSVNKILPKPFHNKLSTIPIKHATHCLAATTHYLLRKKMFHSKISQATFTKEFMVAEKKLHLAISGRKYDPGKKFPKKKPHDKPKPKKKKAAKMDEPKTDEVVKIPEDKEPSPEDLGEPQSNDADDDDDNDSLPDPFSLHEPKTLETKEDQDKKMHKHKQWTQICQSPFAAMKKLPHRKHSQQRNHHRRSCPTNNYLLIFYFCT